MKRFEEKIPERNSRLEWILIINIFLIIIVMMSIISIDNYSPPEYSRYALPILFLINVIWLVIVTTKNDIKLNDYIDRLMDFHENEYQKINSSDEMEKLLINFEEDVNKIKILIGRTNRLRQLHEKYVTTYRTLKRIETTKTN
jgi:hypothetical protein